MENLSAPASDSDFSAEILMWPSSSRLLDCILGGIEHYSCDVRPAERAVQSAPFLADAIRQDRRFVVESVAGLARSGIDQVIDLGCGLPAWPYLDESVAEHQPNGRLLRVDNDPDVVAGGDARLPKRTTVTTRHLLADITRPHSVIGSPPFSKTIDLSHPVVLVLGSVLHHLPDREANLMLSLFGDIVAPGSALVLSHWTADFAPKPMKQVAATFNRAGVGTYLRTGQRIADLLPGWDVMAPGVQRPGVAAPRSQASSYVAMCRKP